MFQDLINLFSGWYLDFCDEVANFSIFTHTFDSDNHLVSITESSLGVWSAYVPWEQIIATVVLVTFVICIFKFMRSVLCKIL